MMNSQCSAMTHDVTAVTKDEVMPTVTGDMISGLVSAIFLAVPKPDLTSALTVQRTLQRLVISRNSHLNGLHWIVQALMSQ